MTYKEAASFVIPIGKHKGMTIDDTASTDDGLRYLDWLYGERSTRQTPLDNALSVYMEDPAIKRELETL